MRPRSAVAGLRRTSAEWASTLWMPVVLVLAAVVTVGAYVHFHSPAASPIDEWVYMDYLFKMPQHWIVHTGDLVGQQAREIDACYGVRNYGTAKVPCGGDYSNLAAFPYSGKTSAGSYLPFYFGITWAIGAAAHAVTGMTLVAGWRLAGAFWLALALVLFVVVARRLGVHDVVTLALGLGFIASPYALTTYTFISTDAPCAAITLALLLLAWSVVRGRASGWWLVPASAVAVAFKVTNLIGIGFAVLFLFVSWLYELPRTRWSGILTRRPDAPKRFTLAMPLYLVLPVAAGAIVQEVWLKYVAATAVASGASQGIAIPFNFFANLQTGFQQLAGTVTTNVGIPSSTGHVFTAAYFEPLGWLCVIGVFGVLCLRPAFRLPFAPLAISTAVMGVAALPVLGLGMHLITGGYFAIPLRYAGMLVLPYFLMMGVLVRNRWARWAVFAYCAGLLLWVVLRSPVYG
ncbi:MAG TPA: hypothetical protein VGC45_11525 [Gryllotalpicola sp.]